MVVSIYVVALILSQKLRVVGDREIHKHDTLVYPSITDKQKKKIDPFLIYHFFTGIYYLPGKLCPILNLFAYPKRTILLPESLLESF